MQGLAAPEASLPFGYADTGLTAAAQDELELGVAWLRCVPEGRAVLVIDTEHHYRNATLEASLSRDRLANVMERLVEAGVDRSRLALDQPADPIPVIVLRLHGRGW